MVLNWYSLRFINLLYRLGFKWGWRVQGIYGALYIDRYFNIGQLLRGTMFENKRSNLTCILNEFDIGTTYKC